MESNQRWFPYPRELFVLALVALPLIVTVSTIEAADWVKGLPSLKVLLLVSLVPWALLARSAIPWWIGHPVALLAGLVVGFFLGSFTLSTVDGVGDLTGRLGDWFGALGSQDGEKGAAITGVFLITVTLWMGHASVWLAYRRSFAALSVLPGLVSLLVVLIFLPSDYYWYFYMYLLAAAPGIAFRHGGRWTVRGSRVPMMGTLGAGLILMGITLVPVWRSPAPDRSVIPQSVGLEDAWYSVSGRWSDLFYGVPNRKQYAFFSPPLSLPITGPDLPFTGSIEELRDDLLFEVESQKPYRWRMRVYETYTSTGWVNDEALVETAVEEANLEGYIGELKARTEVQIGVRLRAKANTLLSVGEPLGTSIRSDVELSPQPSFKMAVEGDQVSYLPPTLRKFRDDLLSLSNDNLLELLQQTQQPRSASGTDDNRSSEPPFGDLRDLGFRVTLPSDDIAGESDERPEGVGQPYVEIERLHPGTGPPLALLGKRVLVPPKEYWTVGSISEANFRMLREAGQDYPAGVTDRYLQLPNDFPEKVRKLARDLADGKANPYDKAEAIRRHMLSLPYSLEVRTPPSGQDWVEFFLFHERRGYCQNYAAAMITMLRSLGIPARLAVGFAPGIWDGDRGVWQVLSRHYHAWPEVYFPRYGWVEFEPTPADVQPALESLGFEPVGGLARGLPDVEECITEIGLVLCDDPDGPSAELDDLFADSRSAGSDASGEGGSGGGILDTLASAWTLLGLGLVLGLVVPVGAFSYIRRGLNRAGYPAVSFASMCLLGRLAGVRLRPQDTPWEYCARLGHALPGHREEVIRVTRGFVSTRYGPNKRPAAEDMEQVRTAWRTVRSPLLRRILLRLLRRRK